MLKLCKILLPLLFALSVILPGFAVQAAGHDCPMQHGDQAGVMQDMADNNSGHDCCPDNMTDRPPCHDAEGGGCGADCNIAASAAAILMPLPSAVPVMPQTGKIVLPQHHLVSVLPNAHKRPPRQHA